MSPERKRILLRAVIFFAIAVIVLAEGIILVESMQHSMYEETRGTGTKEFMESGVVTWNGSRYKKIPAMTTILIAGIDRSADDALLSGTNQYRNGGQADFLILLGIDHTNRQIHQLQIDRDTMTDVIVLSVFGKETGTRVMQICLAHSYGANQKENAKYTITAVRNLMSDLEIDGYYMVDYDTVGVLSDALGGVTVTVPDDMTSVNPLWEKGAVITLTGDEAILFVRTRRTIGRGTNEERMGRQNEFMQNAISRMRSQLSNDSSFATQLLSSLKKNAVTNMSDTQLLEELTQSSAYQVLPVEYLEGEYVIGEGGYMEFYANADSAESWIFRHLYTQEL